MWAKHLGCTKANPELAAEAAERAQRALENEQVETAVLELEKAVELVPHDVDYNALLGWALFCAAHDKRAVAAETEKALERAVHRSERPHLARFYLGRVERMLGCDREALGHFHAVLLVDPNHRDASAEIRVLEVACAPSARTDASVRPLGARASPRRSTPRAAASEAACPGNR